MPSIISGKKRQLSSNFNKNRILVVFHRVDFDGIMSGCIAKKALTDNGEHVAVLGWNYGDKVPDPKMLEQFKDIIMVDISFPPDAMKELKKSGKLTWIDHHHSAIENSVANGYNDVPGDRTIGTAACELTWKYFYPVIKCPKIIQYCGAYDVWDKERFSWETEVLPVQYSLRSEYGLDFNHIFEQFDDMIDGEDAVNYFLAAGEPILKYLKKTWEGWIKAYGFPVKVDGKYNGFCLIGPQFGSAAFETVLDMYDIYVVAERKGPDLYSVSLYKEPDRLPDVNLADYVTKTYGTGGGHASACGFTINLEQFNKLIKDQEI